MKKLNLGFCITDLDAGGAERCLTDLVTGLDRTRFEPVVYCLGPRPTHEEASCVPALEQAGLEVHLLGARRGWQFPWVVRRLTKLLARHQTDVLQTFLFHANVAGRVAARRAGVQRVVSGIRVAERQSRWHLTVDRLTSGLVDQYVCVSRSVAEFSAREGRLARQKLTVIPNGVDVNLYPAQPAADLTATFGGRRLVTFIGRLHRQKGVGWLLETAADWLGQLDDCDLLLVGRGPERAALEEICRRRGIQDRAHFLGWRADAPAILAASRLLVLPSRWEGMPNVVLQAMAGGLPVVSTDVEGVVELLGPHSAPQTVPYGDSEALVSKVVTILSDDTLAAQLGQENRLRAESEFSLRSMIEAYERLYDSLGGH